MDERPLLRVGQVRIESLLGRGGMGTVYLGFDEKLERRVAVKQLHADETLHPAARARFLREARILSKLDHPNICRVYDLVQSEGKDVLLLEYVDGRTLGATDPATLAYERKLAIAATLADVLAAAHREGIVHRDLKPDNVMLASSGEIKVLDFGIARSLTRAPARPPGAPASPPEASDQEASVFDVHTAELPGPSSPASTPPGLDVVATAEGSIIGTLRYMSPEAGRGEDTTPASDVYSLGILLQELFTGRPAYASTDAMELIGQVRFGTTVPIAGLDPALAALLKRLQSPDPAARPSAEEAARLLRDIAQAPAHKRRQRLRWIAAASALAVLAATAAVSFRLARPRPLLPGDQRARIALLPFRNGTGDERLAWVERGLPPMLAEALRGHARMDVLPLPQIAAALNNAGNPAGPLAADAIRKLDRELGSNLVLETELRRHDPGVELLYRLHRQDGVTVKSVLAPDPAEAVAVLARHLELLVFPESPTVELKDRFSADPYANQSYAMGVDQLDRQGAKAAQHYFQICLSRDPGFLWAKVRLAESLQKLGSGADSDSLLREVLAAARSRTDRRLEGETLRRLGANAHERGDYPSSTALIEQSRAISATLNDSFVVAEIQNNLANNAYRQGDTDKAEKLWRDVLERARALGSRKSEGAMLNNLGAVAIARGDVAQAEKLWLAALPIVRDLGYRDVTASVLGNLAVVESGRGHVDRAQSYEEQVLAIRRQTGDRRGEATSLFNLSETFFSKGDVTRARELASEGLQTARQAGDRFGEVHLLAGLAEYQTEAGDTAGALKRLDEADKALAGLDAPEAALGVHTARAGLFIRMGRLAEAERALARARAVDPEAPGCLEAAARLASARGRPAEALKLLEQAREKAQAWGPRLQAVLETYRAAARAPAR